MAAIHFVTLWTPVSPRPQLPGEALSVSCRKGRNRKAAEPEARARRRRREKLGTGRPSSQEAAAAAVAAGMEPLRVLELYSGVGGMHQALRGESAQGTSISSGRCSELGEGRSSEAPGAGTRGLGCPGNSACGPPLQPSAETLLPVPGLRELSSWSRSSRPGADHTAGRPQGGRGGPRPLPMPWPQVAAPRGVGRGSRPRKSRGEKGGGRWSVGVSLVTPGSKGSLPSTSKQ